MKKKHRKAICYLLICMILLIVSPLIVIAYLGDGATWIVSNFIIPPIEWLKRKLRVSDRYQTDRPKQEPRECEHYHEISKGQFVYACCGKCNSDWDYCEYYYKSDCPDFTPKSDKLQKN